MKKVLDTNAILYLLGGRLGERLPAAEYFISVISEMEVLSYPLLDASAQARIQEFLSEVTVIGLSDGVKEHAIPYYLDRRSAVAADAFIIAAE